jgi:hypothetical protein
VCSDLGKLPLSPSKPKRLALTDKGPGVGVNQKQVAFSAQQHA